MNSDVYTFFFEELEKTADNSYYMRNRNRILTQQRMYRRKNAVHIARRQKIYRRKVKSGAKRTRKRIRTGNSYAFAGYR